MLLLVTPLLGSLRNHVKYKNFKPLIFIRTPIIYFFFIFISSDKKYLENYCFRKMVNVRL